MIVRSPECRRSYRICGALIDKGCRDQRQAPVAAETQRRVMRLRISLVMCWSFGLMATFGRMNCGIDYPLQRADGQ